MFIQINNKKIRKDRIESVEIVKSINDDYIPTIKTDNINIIESGDKYVYNIHITTFSGKLHIGSGTEEELNKLYSGFIML